MKIILFSIFLIIYSSVGNTQVSGYSYKGGWPVNPNSNKIEDPGFELPCPGPIGCECKTDLDCDNQNCRSHPKGNYCVPKKGDVLPRFEGLDQFGESVDIYDFANQGKTIILELSAAWCSPCNDLAAWLSSNDLKIKENPWWKDQYLPIRDLIKEGKVQLINIMYEGSVKKTTVTPENVLEWYNKYPDPNVPILADEYRFMHSWAKPTGLPCIFLVDENMRLINYTNRGLADAFLYLTEPSK